jgi:hypothetical protein
MRQSLSPLKGSQTGGLSFIQIPILVDYLLPLYQHYIPQNIHYSLNLTLKCLFVDIQKLVEMYPNQLSVFLR